MLTPKEREVLELAAEDHSGLWEIRWRLATVFHQAPERVVEDAARTVGSLRDRKLAMLCSREWIDDDPLPVERLGRAIDLSSQTTWDEPQAGQPQLLLVATDLGRMALMGET